MTGPKRRRNWAHEKILAEVQHVQRGEGETGYGAG